MAKHKRVPLRVDFFDAASGALKSETRQVDERWFARLANKAIAEGHNVVVPGADGKSLTAFAQEPGRRRQMFRHQRGPFGLPGDRADPAPSRERARRDDARLRGLPTGRPPGLRPRPVVAV